MFSDSFHPTILKWFRLSTLLLLFISLGCASSQIARVGSSKESILIKNSRAKKLVVFVHGLKGGPLTTWNQEDNKDFFFWPEELAKDPKFKRADILSFGYDSDCSSDFNFPDIAGQLFQAVNELVDAKAYKSLSFVAHSFGGLVVREFILSHANDLHRQVPVEHIITLAAPNLRGSVQKVTSHVCGKSDGNGFDADSLLNSVNQRWVNRFDSQSNKGTWGHSAGYELVPVVSLGKIVEKDSAVHLSQIAQGFMKNHPQMARPNDRHDPLYIWVRQLLLNKAPDSRVHKYTDGEVVRIEEVIENLQKQVKGTDKEKILKLVDRGDLDAALAVLYDQSAGADPIANARDRFVKAQIYEIKLDRRNALANYQSAVQLSPENPAYRKEAGVFLMISRQEESASEYLDDAGETGVKSAGSDHPSMAGHWKKLGDTSRKDGDNVKAIWYYEKSLNSFQKTLEPDHPMLARIRSQLGLVRYRNQEHDLAIENWEKTVQSDVKNLGTDDPQMARNWNHLGSAWLAKGGLDKAIGYFEKGLESNLKNFGPGHAEVAFGRSQLGDAWRKKGENGKAIEYYEKAERDYMSAHGPSHPNLAALWNNLGSALRATGDYDQAISNYEKALEVNRKTLGPDHAQVGRDLNNLGAAWSSKEKYDRAIEYFEQARSIFEKAGMVRSKERVEKNLKAARKNKSLLKASFSQAP